MDFKKKENFIIIITIIILIIISSFKFILPKFKSIDKDKNKDRSIENIDRQEDTENTEKEEVSKVIAHISGCVKNPGVFELNSDCRVKDLVELAGGLDKKADLKSINLARKLKDEEKIHIPAFGEKISEEITKSDSGSEETMDKVNINTCTKEDLKELPGIGEITADKIVDYREEKNFKEIKDIKNVSGIGDKKFEDLKDKITVN